MPTQRSIPSHSQTGVPSQHPSQSQGSAGQSISSSHGEAQEAVNNQVILDFVSRVTRCQTLGELLRTIPAPALDRTKHIVEKVIEAFTRQGSCKTLKREWNDALNKGEYERVPELNSLKPPVVQVSALSRSVDEGSLTSLNFSHPISVAKKEALTQMIAIKDQEISNLRTLCDESTVKEKIVREWRSNQNIPGVSPEHMAILLSMECAERLALTALSIGTNSLSRTAILKKKKLEKKTDADVEMTGVGSGDNKKLASLVKEMVRREKQADMDKRSSGKGRGKTGLPKKQNQKSSGVQKKQKQKKPRHVKNDKGTSTKKQQKRR